VIAPQIYVRSCPDEMSQKAFILLTNGLSRAQAPRFGVDPLDSTMARESVSNSLVHSLYALECMVYQNPQR
jgi:hypothetical protein